MWDEVYASALEQYDDEEKAAATAWAAVKEKYEKVDDKWVKKNVLEEIEVKSNSDLTPAVAEGFAALLVMVADSE